MKILILLLMTCGTLFAVDASKLRKKAEGLEKNGNWKEAYDVRLELLREVNDKTSWQDLQKAINAQQRLRKVDEFDSLVNDAVESKGENVEFLLAAGEAFMGAQHYGQILDNEFIRGNASRGEWRQVQEQDRVRALQLYMQAWKSAEKGTDEEVQVLKRLGGALSTNRQGSYLWKLYVKTDIEQAPDYMVQIDTITSRGAPVDSDGKPDWIDIPESWEDANSDGERWRWTMEEIARISKNEGQEQRLQWIRFCKQNYGVNTLASFGWWSQPDVEERDGILQTSSLEEDETIANLATGVSRFKLRKDYQYIPMMRDLMKSGKSVSASSAGDLLVQVFLDRSQFVEAAKTLEEVITLHGPGNNDSRKKLLNQIRGNWSQFQMAPTYYAAKPVEVPFVFRNADDVKLTLSKVKEDQVMADIIKYLKSNPTPLNHRDISFSQLGRKLLEEDGEKYVGKPVRNWTQELEPAEDHSNSLIDLDLGKLDPGCYLLKSELKEGNTSWIVVWVRDLVILQRSEAGKEVFYLTDAKGGAPVVGEFEFFGYKTEYLKEREGNRRYNIITHHFRKKTDEEGRLVLDEKEEWKRGINWQVIARADGRRAYLGNRGFSWRANGSQHQHVGNKTIGITDRPVYRPGQTVHMKLWAGEAKYDLADVSNFAGKVARIEVRDGRNEVVFEKEGLVADEFGGIECDFELGDEAALGNYRVMVRGEIPNTGFSFRVEEYKKPEFEVKVEAPTEPVALGDTFEATVSANYYHGAPVTEATVKIKVERNFFNDRWFPEAPWDWLYGPGYWWCYPEYPWYPGWARWGCVRPPAPWWGGNRAGAPEVVLEKTAAIGRDGKVKVKIDSSIAKLVHGDQDHRYSITAEVVDASRRTIVGNGSVLAAREPYSVTVWLDRGYARSGDKVTGHFGARTLDGKKVEGKAVATLFSTSVDEDGEIVEKKITSWKPDGDHWVFEASEPGQYRVSVAFTDKKGRKQEGATVFSVIGAEDETDGDFRYNAIELIPDKKEYRKGDTVKMLLNVNKPKSRVWLFIRSAQGEKGELKIIRMKKKSRVVKIPVGLSDMPNFFVDAVTIADGEVHRVTREVVVPPEKRKLGVEVLPAKTKLKPREKTSLTIKITDSKGKPYQGSAAITIYDKSLEYISGGSNVGEIVPFFWDWKRHHYGVNLVDSQSLSGSHMQLPNTERMGRLGVFGHLTWGWGGMGRERSIRRQDGFGRMKKKGAMPMSAPGMVLEEAAMKSDAGADEGMILGGVVAGNEAAAPEVMVRSEFADLLKWVGSVKTNEKGEATIDIEMPDNLTTWKIKTWAMGRGTRVGEGSAEIVTSKDLIIRLQAPRFFVEKDEVTLSAVVHNYHEKAKDVSVSLELDGNNLESSGGLERRVAITAGGESRIDWTVKALREGEVTIRMKAIAADDSDAMEMKFPVFVHGMLKTESYSRAISPKGKSGIIEFEIPEERRPSESRITINYSPSVASAMVDALPYLASYPYGCTEQTLNRFVPTTVVHNILKELGHDLASIKDKRANLNPQKIGDPKERAADWHPKGTGWNPVWDEAEVKNMEKAGIAKLREQQNADGGWGWFSAFGDRSYPHTTAVVMHGLILARDNGAEIPDQMIEKGLAWLAKHEETEADKIANWGKRKKNIKKQADSGDALVRRVLGEGSKDNKQMLGFLFRDKNDLPVYAKALLGLELHRTDAIKKRDEVIRNIRQFLQRDEENQTAYLDLGNQGYWWYWYGSEFEAQAWFLKLLAAAEPKSADARGLVKYLINNRSNATYWNSTRDTAYCLEAIGDYLKASGEGSPDLSVDVIYDGKKLKTVKITKDNLFTFDSSAIISGDIVTGGKHKIELRKRGKGPLYANAYVEYFTLEDFITKAGLEVKVDRTFYKLIENTELIDAVDSQGQAIDQKRSRYQRVELKSGDEVKSGDLIEVVLGIDSKNDYEYLLFEDWKAAGMEPVEVRSGYNSNGLGAYMELRDEKVSMFVQNLPRGRHNLSYRLRAEIPGKFSALPTKAEAMYAPELRANSDEMKIEIAE
ncbi:MAG: alpha-2-macroglobulin [Akkermansiaceae bacterium]